jgi:cytochrome c oxidase subunit III
MTMASDAHADHHHGPKYLAHHFETPVQQFDAAKLGMWAFLAQEILFFSGIFVAYLLFRSWYPEAWSLGSRLLDWRLGMLNTFVLLISSFTAAQAVASAQRGEQKKTTIYLAITLACAAAFMVVKYFEYSHKIHIGLLPGRLFNPTEEGWAEMTVAAGNSFGMETAPAGTYANHLRSYLGLYFMATGLHGIHVLVGMGVITWIMLRNIRGEFTPEFWTPVDLVALYWHLVDLVWIYLFPFLYLID